MIEITDLHIPQLDMYIDKKEAQLLHYFEPEPGLFIAESPNVILRALEAGYEPISILMEKRLEYVSPAPQISFAPARPARRADGSWDRAALPVSGL